MATQKSLTEIVCDAVKALQDPKGSRLKQIFSYAKEVTQNVEISLGKIKLALKNAIDNKMLHRTYDGRFNLNLPDVPNTGVQDMKNEDDFIEDSCCPKRRRRRRRRSCKRRRRSCRRRRRRSCRRKRRRRSCKPRKRRRSCTKMWVPKRRRRC